MHNNNEQQASKQASMARLALTSLMCSLCSTRRVTYLSLGVIIAIIVLAPEVLFYTNKHNSDTTLSHKVWFRLPMTERHRETEIERWRDRQTRMEKRRDGETGRRRNGQIDRETERQRETEKDRERQRETERDGERHRET